MATSEKSKAGTAKKAAPAKTTAAKAPAAKKAASTSAKAAAPAAAKAAAPKAPATKSVAKPAAPAKTRKSVDPEVRRHYVAVAAYYIAERRGFLGGRAHEDWLQAEVEIDQLLAANKLSA